MLLKIDKLTCSIKLQDIKTFVITFCKKLKKCSYMQYGTKAIVFFLFAVLFMFV
jgi:hypothetical protein